MEGDCGIDDKFVVVNKFNGGVLKTGDSQGKVLGKTGLCGGKRNELVGTGIEDKYKQDRQPLIFAPIYVKGIHESISAITELPPE